jgi:drug/metabolite transporter (DMT)-like permease
MAQLLFAAAAWGTSMATTKVALAAIDTLHLTSLRFGLAALVYTLMLGRIEGAGALRAAGQFKLIFVMGIVGVVGGVLLMVVGLDRTRAEHAAVIVGAQPLIMTILVWLLHGQRPARHSVLAMVLALFGVFLVVTRGDPRSVGTDASVIGDLLVLGATLCWVTYTLGARAFPLWSPLRYTTLTMGVGAGSVLVMNAFAVAAGLVPVPSAAQFSSVGWELFYITVVSSLLGTLSWNSGIRRVGSDGFLFINFVPVTAFAVGIAQGYRFNWAEIVGAALVMGTLVANHLASRHRTPGTGSLPKTPAGSQADQPG